MAAGSEAVGGAEKVPVEGEPREEEAGHGDEGELQFGDEADVREAPNTAAGKDSKETEENADGGGDVDEDEVSVDSVSGQHCFVAQSGDEHSNARGEDDPGGSGEARAKHEAGSAGLLLEGLALGKKDGAADANEKRNDHQGQDAKARTQSGKNQLAFLIPGNTLKLNAGKVDGKAHDVA